MTSIVGRFTKTILIVPKKRMATKSKQKDLDKYRRDGCFSDVQQDIF